MSRTMKCFVLTIVVLLCAAPVLHSQDLSKAEEKEVNDYRLSKAKITQFSQATKNLLAAAQKDPTLFDAHEKSGPNNSIAAVVDATNKIPAAKKAIEDAGMTAKDYWMFQMAMLYAAAGHMATKAGGTLPPGFSKENVDFYRANEAEFMKMGDELKRLQDLQNKGSSEEEQEDPADEEQSEE